MTDPDPATSRPDPFGWLADHERARRANGLRRTLVSRGAGPGPLDLASNDYLGLARDPRVVAGALEAVRTWGAGATGSRLVTGSTTLHAELEAALAALTGTTAGLVFSSGFLANTGAVVALSGPGALVVSDAHNHASLVDACRLSRARVVVTPHLDVDAVAATLAARGEERALVVTDGVFSVDGERAPVGRLAAVCAAAGAGLLVDEAHALGVLGPGGAGVAADAGVAGRPGVVLTATLSKSLGAQGGAVLGSQAVVDHLVDTARSFVFDTALAPGSAGAALAAVRLLSADPGLPDRVRAVVAALHRAVLAAGLAAPTPQAAVIGVQVGAPQAALAAAAAALARGVRVGCFRPPTVPDGISRLRVTARADLDGPDLQLAGAALADAAAAARVPSAR
jgi:8-amino-7-oxononanoate synthase